MSKRFREIKELYRKTKRECGKNNVFSKRRINNALVRWNIHGAKYVDKMFRKAERNSNSLTAHKLPLDKKAFEKAYKVFY